MYLRGLFPLLPLLLLLPIASALGTSCIKVVAALVGRPSDIFYHFQREICDVGCKPTIPHWDLWARNNTFVPAARDIARRLRAPQEEAALIRMGDEAANSIKTRCGPLLGGRDICSDDDTLAGFGNCFKKTFLRSALLSVPTLLPMVSDAICKEQYEFLNQEELWQEIIPGNMREYAQSCQNLEDGMQVLDTNWDGMGVNMGV